MDELFNQISSELSKNELDPIWISVIDLNRTYGETKLSPETSKHCNVAITGEKINGYYRFLKAFFRSSRYTNHLSRKDRPNTRPPNTSMARQHKSSNTCNKRKTHSKTGISPNKNGERKLQGQQKELEILQKRNSMAGTHHLTRWTQTKQRNKTDVINELNPPTDTKTLKSLLGAIQYFAKLILNLSKKTDNMRQLLEKGTNWEWTEERNAYFNDFKRELTTQSCLAHYNGRKNNIVTTEACSTGLGIAQ